MKYTQIKYKTSTDYFELFRLLKSGNIIIGFVALETNGVPITDYCKVVPMFYNDKNKMFDLGFVFFESDFDKIDFKTICERYKIQYIPL